MKFLCTVLGHKPRIVFISDGHFEIDVLESNYSKFEIACMGVIAGWRDDVHTVRRMCHRCDRVIESRTNLSEVRKHDPQGSQVQPPQNKIKRAQRDDAGPVCAALVVVDGFDYECGGLLDVNGECPLIDQHSDFVHWMCDFDG